MKAGRWVPLVIALLNLRGATGLAETPQDRVSPPGYSTGAISVSQLCQAVMVNDVKGVKNALQSGANPNQACPSGLVPLAIAMDVGSDSRIADSLLVYGADVNISRPNENGGRTKGWTPLFYAVQSKRSDLVALLLKHGAKTQVTDTDGKSPLSLAREMSLSEIAQLLSEAAGKKP